MALNTLYELGFCKKEKRKYISISKADIIFNSACVYELVLKYAKPLLEEIKVMMKHI